MPVIQAEFDGRVFVPCEAVAIPAGTKVEIVVPSPPLTPEQQARLDEVQRQLDATEPYFPTVEEALRYSRKRP